MALYKVCVSDSDEILALNAIYSVVLQGAIHMFLLVQRLPNDRFWAHQALGLTVLFKKHDPNHGQVKE